MCQGKFRTDTQVEAQGRKVIVPRCAEMSDIAWFEFADLCNKPLGAADYLAIGRAFRMVFVANIPKLTIQDRDQVRRFITLIDSFYECRKVVCTAELDPIPVFYVSEEERKTSTADEIFAWDRTASCPALAANSFCLSVHVCFWISLSFSLSLCPSFFEGFLLFL